MCESGYAQGWKKRVKERVHYKGRGELKAGPVPISRENVLG